MLDASAVPSVPSFVPRGLMRTKRLAEVLHRLNRHPASVNPSIRFCSHITSQRCSVLTRADVCCCAPPAGIIFGVPTHAILQQRLHRFLEVPAGMNVRDFLLGPRQPVRKGMLKVGRRMSRSSGA